VAAVSGAFKVRRIKDNHMILMLTLAKRCLEDNQLALSEFVINVRFDCPFLNAF
jgi:hypothetical protein